MAKFTLQMDEDVLQTVIYEVEADTLDEALELLKEDQEYYLPKEIWHIYTDVRYDTAQEVSQL